MFRIKKLKICDQDFSFPFFLIYLKHVLYNFHIFVSATYVDLAGQFLKKILYKTCAEDLGTV